MSKQQKIIALFIIVLLISISFLLGVYLGKTKFSAKQINLEKEKLVTGISEKIKKLPGLEVFKFQPANIIHAQIKTIKNSSLIVRAEPSSVEELLANERELEVKITAATKIYYLEINSDTNSFVEHPLLFSQLQEDEMVAIIIDPKEKLATEVSALEIKVNR